jgi:hypothetical protein
MNKNVLHNFVSDLEQILRKVRPKLKPRPTAFALEDSTIVRSLTPTFEVMANMTLCDYSAPTTANICTGSAIDVGDKAFELKPALNNMVQAS